MGGKIPAEQAGDVHLHPKAAEVSAAMADSLVREFKRWMEDEIEEITERIHQSADGEPVPNNCAEIAILADQLAEQAEMLGYPRIVDIAGRLKQCAGKDALESNDASNLDQQLAELRSALSR